MTKDQATAPKWLPDWTSADNYPSSDTDVTRMTQWAWEFLRRNSIYQKDYDRAKELSWEFTEDPSRAEYVSLCKKYGIENMCDPSSQFTSDIEQKLGFPNINTPNIKFVDHRDWLGYQQSIEDPYDRDHSRVGNVAPKYFLAAIIPSQEHELTIKLDLSQPLPWVLKGVIDTIKSCWSIYHWGEGPEKNHNKTPGSYKEYLRILDARAQGISHGEIAKVLHAGIPNPRPYPVSELLRKQEIRANQLRDREYQFLPGLEKHNSERSIEGLISDLRRQSNNSQ